MVQGPRNLLKSSFFGIVKSWFFGNIFKVNKSVAILIRKKREQKLPIS